MESSNTIKVGVNALVIKEDKVLLGIRLNTSGDGEYGVPGGHLEFGESLEGCIIRELEEETGLIPDELDFVCAFNQPRTATPQHYIQFLYVCKKFHGSLETKEPDKCAGWEWFDIDDLPKNIFQAHKDFVKAYQNKTILLDAEL